MKLKNAKSWLARLGAEKRALLSAEDVQVLDGEIELLAATKEEGDVRKFRMLAYTGSDFARWYGRAAIDLSGIQASESFAILHEHDDQQPIAVADSWSVTEKGLEIEGHMLSNSTAREIAKNADEGLPYRCSVGVRIESREQLEDGVDAEVNGRQMHGPLEIWRRVRLFETSFITCNPADLNTVAEVMSGQPDQENRRMDRKALLALITENPELANELRAEGAQSERDSRVERAKELTEAFPKRPKFVARMLNAGKTLLEAKAELTDILLKEMAERGKDANGKRLSSSDKRKINRLEERARGSRGDRFPGLGFDGRAREGGETDRLASLPPIERAKAICERDPNLAKLFRDYADPGVEKLLAASLVYETKKRPNEASYFNSRLIQLTADEIKAYADGRFGPINDERMGSWGKSAPDYTAITVKGFLGYFYMRFEQELAGIWAPMIALRVESSQETEIHRFLGLFPQLSEWLGGIREDSMPMYQFALTNKLYRASVGVDKNDYKFQKFGLLTNRIGESGAISAEHWNQLVSSLITSNGTAYDGQAFFSGTHTLGGLSGMALTGAGNMTNDLTKADYGVLNPADPTNPTAQEHVDICMTLASHLRQFLANNGQPINGGAKRFVYMVPAHMEGRATQALKAARLNFGADNALGVQENAFTVIPNARLTNSKQVYLFREDCTNKAFILQEPGPPELLFQGPGSFLEWAEHKYGFGIESTRAAGYGGWETAVRATLG